MTRPTHEIDAYLDGDPTPDQARALEDWIQSDPANAQAFLAAIRLHQQIGTQLRKDRFDQALRSTGQPATTKDGDAAIQALAELARLDEEVFQSPVNFATWREEQADKAAAARRKIWQTRTIIGSAVAAALLLAATLLTIVFTGDAPEAPLVDNTPTETTEPGRVDPVLPDALQPVATLTASHNAQWAERALARGSGLRPGQRLTLTAGFAEITTHRGAIAILEAPATVELIDNDNAIRLHTGKLVGICETDSSKGFLVRTPHMDITDLGTEFGVEVRGNQSTATVFTGEIELTALGGEPQPLAANQTARLSIDGNNRQFQVEDRIADGFIKRMPLAPLATAAFSNNDRFEVEVVTRGVREDAKARTDRPHELNGVDATGIPRALINGDLIRTPGYHADLSHQSGFQIEVEVSAPATVYVLLNEEEQPPAWLIRDYKRTDMLVGLDLGVVAESNDLLGVGPGESIGQVCHVWQRKEPAVGRIVVGGEMVGQSSYTIIVVPAESPNP